MSVTCDSSVVFLFFNQLKWFLRYNSEYLPGHPNKSAVVAMVIPSGQHPYREPLQSSMTSLWNSSVNLHQWNTQYIVRHKVDIFTYSIRNKCTVFNVHTINKGGKSAKSFLTEYLLIDLS